MARRDVKNGEDHLIVEGLVVNTVEQTLELPRLKIALTDADGKEILAHSQKLAKTHLAPGETTPFAVKFKNPPSRARSMQIEFSLPANRADGPSR